MRTMTLCFVLLTLASASRAGVPDADAYRSPGKLQAPVEFVGKAIYRVEVGEKVVVPLILDLGAPASQLRVEVVASDGLVLERGRATIDAGAAAKGRVALAPIGATALLDGRHYIGVNVFMRSGGRDRFRTFSIPLDAGDASRAQAAKRAQISTDRDGRPLHILPARDTD